MFVKAQAALATAFLFPALAAVQAMLANVQTN